MLCPCGSKKEFSTCCEPFLNGLALPSTAEELMRSRYTAYTQNNITYLKETTAPEKRGQFKEEDFAEWASVEWLSLNIISTKDKVVEFMAKYKADGKTYDHHEVSKFRQIGPKWFFVDGDSHVHGEGDHDHHHHHHGHHQETIKNEEPKIDRNSPCPCGSGKKYKKCHGA
jgi:SEC-C motif domain protein